MTTRNLEKKKINGNDKGKHEHLKVKVEHGVGTRHPRTGKDPSSTKGYQVLCHSSGWYVQHDPTRWPVEQGELSGKNKGIAAGFCGLFWTRAEMKSLVATKLRNLDRFALKVQ